MYLYFRIADATTIVKTKDFITLIAIKTFIFMYKTHTPAIRSTIWEQGKQLQDTVDSEPLRFTSET
jgi:hypothetical protein